MSALSPSLGYVYNGNYVEAPLLMRGVGNYGFGEPSVGFFQDGVYFDPETVPAFTTTHGEAEIYRAEVEARVRPVERLAVGAAPTFLHAEDTDYEAEVVGPDGVPARHSFDGKRLPYVPAYEVTF